jgi:outer membrane protein OmpA-like peptidoglycan-associated protein
MKRILTAFAAALVIGSAGSAAAQGDRGFSAQNFQIAPGYGSFLTVEGSQVPPGLGGGVGLLLDYQYAPLVVRGCAAVAGDACTDWTDDKTALVEHWLGADLYGSLSLFRVFELGVVVPTVLYQTGDDAPTIESPAGTTGLGDPRVHAKLDLLHTFGYEGDAVGLALVPVVTFPVGNAIDGGSFLGDSSVTVHPKLAFGLNFAKARLGINAGYLWREAKQLALAEVGPRITYGAAVEVLFGERVSGIVELFGQNGMTSDVTESPLEGDLAVRFRWESGLALTVGGGAGIIAGVGTPAARAFAGVAWTKPAQNDRDEDGILDEVDACPDDPEDLDRFEDVDGCPDPDNDKDGVLDIDDGCPTDPEDADAFADADGCPDPDNDEDGILDGDDACPNEAEDKDGFADADGCPDPDNDEDGVLDGDDGCPNEAEDKDGFEDANGCPDPDNDQDGILDQADECPDEAEDKDDYEDDDGCPDPTHKLVEVKKDQIVILEQIYFETAKARIKKVSYPICDAVVAVLDENPAIKVRIEGHTDSRGKADYNRKLSESRAKAVLKYLVDKGIDPDRLTAQGFGPDRPIDTNDTRKGRAKNRRVEFHITER